MVNAIRYLRRALFVLVLVVGAAASAAAQPCATSLSACPSRGCAQAGTPDAKVNEAKRATPSGPLRHLTLDDFEALQQQATAKPGVRQNRAIADRALLQSFMETRRNLPR